MNVEPAEGILVQEPEAEIDTVDGSQGTASGHFESSISDEEARKNLRDHLRKAITEDTQAGDAGQCLFCFYPPDTIEDASKRAQRRRDKSVDVGELQPPGTVLFASVVNPLCFGF